jgi:ligand-binding sensor domain-containing protein
MDEAYRKTKMSKQFFQKNFSLFLVSLLISISSHAQSPPTSNLFHAGTIDKRGDIWWGLLDRGVYRYNAASNTFSNFTKVDGLCDNSVNCVYEDHKGVLWFGTAYGVSTYDPAHPEKKFTTFKRKEDLCKYDIACILEDRTGNYWFGTNGYGVCEYNPGTGAFKNYSKENGLPSGYIQVIFEDDKGILWFGTRAGGVGRYDPSEGSNKSSVTFQAGPVSASHVNEKTFSHFIVQGCINEQTMGIVQDNSGDIWIAELYGGVCRYNPTSGSFTHYGEENGFCNDTVTCMYKDKSGNLWFGHDRGRFGERGGICRYDFNTRTFTALTTKDGLPNPDVWGFVEDNAGNIWIGSRGGICKYNLKTGMMTDMTSKVEE